MNTLKVVICATTMRGGVSGFYSAVRSKLSQDVTFFPIGSRGNDTGIVRTVSRVFRDSFLFYRLLACDSYDIVHLNPSLDPKALVRDGLLLLIASLVGVKSVVFFHGWSKPWDKYLERYFLLPFRWVYSKATVILVLALEFKNDFERMGFSQSIHVVTTAVDDELFSPALERAIFSRRTTVNGGFNILFLSRIEKAKGIYESLEALQILGKNVPFARLIVAGEGKELQTVKQYVHSKQICDVEFVGHVVGSIKTKTFLRADAFLFPTSYGEGMPVSVLEAMAFGLPVITRPVGGINDFFLQGKMGFLTDSLEQQEFDDLLTKLIWNPDLRREISLFNRQYAKKHFADSEVANHIDRIYDEVVNTSDPGSS